MNLLPQAYQNNAKSQALKNRLMYGAVLLLLALFAFNQMLYIINLQQADIYKNLLNENAELQQIISSLESSDQSRNDSTQISSFIDRITGESIDLSQVLVRIANSAPQNVRITYFDFNGEEGGYIAIIQANAEAYPSISEWTRNLTLLGNVGEITISAIAMDEASEDKRINFELRVPIQ